ncbi:hypothetical protein FHETE_1418 [Fusarium heterosporum]|uniref:DRBM domain-containing protein n=1 Tax=Fusarium heterosporum TaxID=42747 RepID=A0A8H5X1D2_FUSHE|nr:hypothetical protein FHETE_1418 [Fusarium heterosporum]
MNHGAAAFSGGIPWDQLIRFANEKKIEEKESGKPAQLNQQQIIAISQLIDLVQDIEVEDGWVAELNEFCQQNRFPLPLFTSETFNLQVYGTNVPRSRVTCVLPSKGQAFPQEGYGCQADQQVPSFKKAQKAKNFAAMYALKFLRGDGPSPRGSKRPAPMAQESPAHTRVKAEEDSSDGGASTAGPSIASGKRAQPPTSSAVSPVTVTQGPTIRERIAGLGGRLGFGIPQYHIEPDNVVNGTWKGRPVFRKDGRIPEGMGVVTGAMGKQEAEELVAQKVLEWLQAEEQLREEQFTSIMNSI